MRPWGFSRCQNNFLKLRQNQSWEKNTGTILYYLFGFLMLIMTQCGKFLSLFLYCSHSSSSKLKAEKAKDFVWMEQTLYSSFSLSEEWWILVRMRYTPKNKVHTSACPSGLSPCVWYWLSNWTALPSSSVCWRVSQWTQSQTDLRSEAMQQVLLPSLSSQSQRLQWRCSWTASGRSSPAEQKEQRLLNELLLKTCII